MNGILNVKRLIADLVTQAAAKSQQTGKLPPVYLPAITVEHPQNPLHGDYAVNIALRLAKSTGLKPLDIAHAIAGHIELTPEICHINVAPPGFINFTLSPSWLGQQIHDIQAAGNCFGNLSTGAGKKLQVEFVSANPTGPIHVGHGRGAVLGSSLASALAAAGYKVETEFYVNDAGNQVLAFKRSLYARYLQALGIDAPMPENGYFGTYMVNLAKEILQEEGERFQALPETEASTELGKIGLIKMLGLIRTDLEMLQVSFNHWFSEESLFANGQYSAAMKVLRDANYLVEKEGATWFVSTALGEAKDNVVVRSDGTPTYFGTDIAYHYNKFIERGYDRVIDIWGADHQGHVSRMKAIVSAIGVDSKRLEVIIAQLVTLKRGNELVRLSKRTGDIITLREVIEEVGADACRFNFIARSADSQMDFDLELAKKQSAENPVYYIQYAYARISSVLSSARESIIDFAEADVSLLREESELALLRQMVLLPEIITTVVDSFQPHHLAYYALQLATVFHQFYKNCRVMCDDTELCKARLKLISGTRIVLERTLKLMGMSAPESM